MRVQINLALTYAVLLLTAWSTNCLAIDFPYRSFAQTFGQAAAVEDFSFDHGNFAFRDFQRNINSTDSGSLQVIASPGTFIPDSGFFLDDVGFPSLDGHTVAFSGLTGDVVLRHTNGAFALVSNDRILGHPIARDGRVAVVGGAGIVVESNGASQVLVNSLPAGLIFGGRQFEERISYDGQHAAYIGYKTDPFVQQMGIYKDDLGNSHTVADINTAIPGGTGNFLRFDDPAIDAGKVAFAGFGQNGQSGIYSDLTGTLTALVDRNTPVPGGGQFLHFDGLAPAFDQGHIAFVARILDTDNSEKFALFTNATGPLTRIVSERDQLGLDERLELSNNGAGKSRVWLRGNELAFNSFDTRGDIYVVTVPEPSSFILAALGLIGLVVWRLRRR